MSLSGVYIVSERFNVDNESSARYLEKGEVFKLTRNDRYRGKYRFELEFLDDTYDTIYHKYQMDAIKKHCEKTEDYPEFYL